MSSIYQPEKKLLQARDVNRARASVRVKGLEMEFGNIGGEARVGLDESSEERTATLALDTRTRSIFISSTARSVR